VRYRPLGWHDQNESVAYMTGTPRKLTSKRPTWVVREVDRDTFPAGCGKTPSPWSSCSVKRQCRFGVLRRPQILCRRHGNRATSSTQQAASLIISYNDISIGNPAKLVLREPDSSWAFPHSSRFPFLAAVHIRRCRSSFTSAALAPLSSLALEQLRPSSRTS
jgi:hypothetical protein